MRGSGLILGIESSCDETAAAVVERGARTLSSVVASQISTHARYGGVVPELASREHLRAIVPVVRAALVEAGIALANLDAVAVTAGPGLAGALLVGVTFAKALAFAQELPLIAVNHLEGHIHAVLLHELEAEPQGRTLNEEPALALVVSGGHTHLYLAQPLDGVWSYRLVGRTVDDAAGEAYDKVAKLLGFGYPGGPWIDALARFGDPHAVPFAFSQIKHKVHLGGKPPRTKAARTAPIAELDPHFLFSFSGIKTAVLRYVELHGLREEAQARAARLFAPQTPDASSECHPVRAQRVEGSAFYNVAEGPGSDKAQPASKPPQNKEEALALCPQPVLDLVASFQRAVVGDLMKKSFAAAEALGARRILVTGGVAANRELRARFNSEAAQRGLRVAFPTLALSTDNAAMIAAAAWPRFLAGEFAGGALSGDPSLALGGR
ncbi:MAG: tRNA (adenosine(37)-N6)-threonylcarbamoyltransferase complex transferase subunit TsaD [Terracidiphilus sp.]|jgi:N6-L-threonylcarbamoyladenine synthase